MIKRLAAVIIPVYNVGKFIRKLGVIGDVENLCPIGTYLNIIDSEVTCYAW